MARSIARVEDPGADAVALAWLVAEATGEDEVVGLAPARRHLVLAQDLDQLGVERDAADAGRGLRGSDGERAVAQVEVAPAQVGQLGDSQPTGHDRRRQQRSVRPRGPQERLDLLAAEAGPPRLGLLQLRDLGLDRVVVISS